MFGSIEAEEKTDSFYCSWRALQQRSMTYNTSCLESEQFDGWSEVESEVLKYPTPVNILHNIEDLSEISILTSLG